MTYRKGDRCRILDNGTVEHYDCHTWADGVVTNIRTGNPVSTWPFASEAP